LLGSITDRILSLSAGWALAVVFLGPALESSAFVGFVFPGEVAVLLGGVLAYQGRVSRPGVIVAAVLGAVAGDTIGYWVGRRWGHQMLRWIGHRIPFLKHRVDDHLERARAYLDRRGGMAVLVPQSLEPDPVPGRPATLPSCQPTNGWSSHQLCSPS
jgi:membrane protein DedA with SNARE-associated domain